MLMFVKFDIIVLVQAACIASVIGSVSEQSLIAGTCLCANFRNTPVRNAPCGAPSGSATSGICFQYKGNNDACDSTGQLFNFFEIDFEGKSGWVDGNHLIIGDQAKCRKPDLNTCASNPCQNDATCVNGQDEYTCRCNTRFEGRHCEIDKYQCPSRFCENGGSCIPGHNLVCICAPGYTGPRCQIDINECESTPCQHNGTCTQDIDLYTCDCAPGYTGLQCQTDINECASTPCKFGGTCVDYVNRYTCTCVAGYTGVHCETNINECASAPCRNGGSCIDGVNKYTCSCVPGYNGLQCQTNINECSSYPCQNRGVCVDGINRYTCNCPANTIGTNCETKQAVQYKVDVYTANEFLAGTGARVFVHLISDYDRTGAHGLGDDVKDQGSVRTYYINSAVYPVLREINIGHDNSGVNPGWKLDRVSIRNQKTNQIWWFYCNCWFKKGEALSRYLSAN